MTAEAMSQGLTPAVTSAERSGGTVAVAAIGGGRLLGAGDTVRFSWMDPFDATGDFVGHL